MLIAAFHRVPGASPYAQQSLAVTGFAPPHLRCPRLQETNFRCLAQRFKLRAGESCASIMRLYLLGPLVTTPSSR